MNPNLIKKLQDFFRKNPITMGEPSTAEELLFVEQTMQLKLDETHRYLLLHYGGVVIGDIRIYFKIKTKSEKRLPIIHFSLLK